MSNSLKVRVSEKYLGKLVFVGLQETLYKRVQKGRRTENIPESEVFLLSSDRLGTITVTVPAGKGLKGNFYGKEVCLETVSVEIRPTVRQNEALGSVEGRTREYLMAEKLMLKGAK